MPIETSPTRNAVRRFNKRVLNPMMLRMAGRKHWYASVIRHIGRASGRSYATPVVAERVTDGFIIPLPYGTDVDWLRNAMVAGTASITSEGRSFTVSHPQVIDAATAGAQLTDRRRRVFAAFGIGQFVKFDSETEGSENTDAH